jgi:branched-chain amino acid transport system ATP-binding protein
MTEIPAPNARAPGAAPLLELNRLTMRFGGLTAVDALDLAVFPGEIFSLIGPNGAGKTTAFNATTGFYAPSDGAISFKGRPVAGRRPWQIAKLGMARTFQNIRLFGGASVWENVAIAGALRTHATYLEAMLRLPRHYRAERALEAAALDGLEFVGLRDRRNDLARNLPYGQQRRLEIARALATRPELLLLDEPAAGMNPQETDELMALIHRIRDSGVTVLLIEHDMSLVMRISDRIACMSFGSKIAEGTPAEIQANPAVVQAYLGEGD